MEKQKSRGNKKSKVKTPGSNVDGSEDRRGLESSFLDKIKELISKNKQEKEEQTSEEEKNESNMDSFPVTDIEETEPWLNISQNPGYDPEDIQGVLGTVLEAEKKAREPDVSEDPSENRELPGDEIEQEVTETEKVREEETKKISKEEKDKKKRKNKRGSKKKAKNKKKGQKADKSKQTKTKCLGQR